MCARKSRSPKSFGVKSGQCNGTPKKGGIKVVIFLATFTILLTALVEYDINFVYDIINVSKIPGKYPPLEHVNPQPKTDMRMQN